MGACAAASTLGLRLTPNMSGSYFCSQAMLSGKGVRIRLGTAMSESVGLAVIVGTFAHPNRPSKALSTRVSRSILSLMMQARFSYTRSPERKTSEFCGSTQTTEAHLSRGEGAYDDGELEVTFRHRVPK